MRPGGHRFGIAALLCGLAVFAGACSDGSDPLAIPVSVADDDSVEVSSSTSSSTSSTSTSTTSTTTTTVVEAEPDAKPLIEIPTEWPNAQAEIFGRYLLYWDALYVALGPPAPNADYAPLSDLVDVDFMEDLEEQAESFDSKGVYVALPEDSITEHILRLTDNKAPEKIEGDEVIIQDCWVDDSEIRTFDGELSDANRRSILRNVTMKVIGGEWRVWAAITAFPESDGYEECTSYIDQL